MNADTPQDDAARPQNNGDPSRSPGAGDVGSLAEEAAKLAAAFSAWAVDGGTRAGHHLHDVGAGVAEGVHAAVNDLDEHLATGAQECTTCPICRTVSAVREVSPEVKQHLGTAASALAAAASGFLAAFAAGGRASEAPTASGPGHETGDSGPASAGAAPDIERIDLDE